MTISRTPILLGLFLAAALGSSSAKAEMSPEAYVKLQAEAPESMMIDVQKVYVWKFQLESPTHEISALSALNDSNRGDELVEVIAVAKVKSVTRSQSGVQPGQLLTIRYSRTERAIALLGPGEILQLTAGQNYPAFLKYDRQQRVYVPAAGRSTFNHVYVLPKADKKT